MYDDAAFVGLFAAFAGIFAIIALVGIANYVLMSLGLMRMASNQEIDNPWLAWIPIGNLWIMGKIIKTIELGSKKFEQAELILVLASVGSMVLAAIPFVGALINLAVMILGLMVMYKIYKMYAPGKEMLYTILSFIFAIIAPGILFFKIRDNTPVEVE